ncbi:hypothetical protein K7640_22955 [Micromonospora sp. PLK6-60]|uniref:hypothetical protein n=1 Tax=Micromonospora sp. PLK6-60 TaxID=2873383 RepID=UPI001CA6CBAF|nr:hypothetical protein [Micromonospora sp. PLK6-60]MBY8874691.1 hypothetical protein [Micromonospora sp. PLK6-60]
MHPDDSPEQKQPATRPASRSTDAPSPERRVGRHRVPEPPRRALVRSAPFRVALATGVTCALGAAAFAGAGLGDAEETPHDPLREAMAERAATAADQPASRSLDRAAVRLPPAATGSPTPAPKPTTHRAIPRKPVPPGPPRPVAGLDQAQMNNAKVIVDVGRGLKMPRRALVVALSTAMQESDLHNLASEVVPESRRYPHQGTGADHDSVGLFQQRPSSGWGTVRQLMDPKYAARAFYLALREVPGWQDLSVTAAAQAVQISAFPNAYAPHERRATTVVAALLV